MNNVTMIILAAWAFTLFRQESAASAGPTVSAGPAPGETVRLASWRTGTDGKPFDVAALPSGATYLAPCLEGDTLFQEIWCARGGVITYGVPVAKA